MRLKNKILLQKNTAIERAEVKHHSPEPVIYTLSLMLLFNSLAIVELVAFIT